MFLLYVQNKIGIFSTRNEGELELFLKCIVIILIFFIGTFSFPLKILD